MATYDVITTEKLFEEEWGDIAGYIIEQKLETEDFRSGMCPDSFGDAFGHIKEFLEKRYGLESSTNSYDDVDNCLRTKFKEAFDIDISIGERLEQRSKVENSHTAFTILTELMPELMTYCTEDLDSTDRPWHEAYASDIEKAYKIAKLISEVKLESSTSTNTPEGSVATEHKFLYRQLFDDEWDDIMGYLLKHFTGKSCDVDTSYADEIWDELVEEFNLDDKVSSYESTYNDFKRRVNSKMGNVTKLSYYTGPNTLKDIVPNLIPFLSKLGVDGDYVYSDDLAKFETLHMLAKLIAETEKNPTTIRQNCAVGVLKNMPLRQRMTNDTFLKILEVIGAKHAFITNGGNFTKCECNSTSFVSVFSTTSVSFYWGESPEGDYYWRYLFHYLDVIDKKVFKRLESVTCEDSVVAYNNMWVNELCSEMSIELLNEEVTLKTESRDIFRLCDRNGTIAKSILQALGVWDIVDITIKRAGKRCLNDLDLFGSSYAWTVENFIDKLKDNSDINTTYWDNVASAINNVLIKVSDTMQKETANLKFYSIVSRTDDPYSIAATEVLRQNFARTLDKVFSGDDAPAKPEMSISDFKELPVQYKLSLEDVENALEWASLYDSYYDSLHKPELNRGDLWVTNGSDTISYIMANATITFIWEYTDEGHTCWQYIFRYLDRMVRKADKILAESHDTPVTRDSYKKIWNTAIKDHLEAKMKNACEKVKHLRKFSLCDITSDVIWAIFNKLKLDNIPDVNGVPFGSAYTKAFNSADEDTTLRDILIGQIATLEPKDAWGEIHIQIERVLEQLLELLHDNPEAMAPACMYKNEDKYSISNTMTKLLYSGRPEHTKYFSVSDFDPTTVFDTKKEVVECPKYKPSCNNGIYLTAGLLNKFFEKMGCKKAFYTNAKITLDRELDHLIDENTNRILTSCDVFIWKNSPEGQEYWSQISITLAVILHTAHEKAKADDTIDCDKDFAAKYAELFLSEVDALGDVDRVLTIQQFDRFLQSKGCLDEFYKAFTHKHGENGLSHILNKKLKNGSDTITTAFIWDVSPEIPGVADIWEYWNAIDDCFRDRFNKLTEFIDTTYTSERIIDDYWDNINPVTIDDIFELEPSPNAEKMTHSKYGTSFDDAVSRVMSSRENEEVSLETPEKSLKWIPVMDLSKLKF